MQGLYVLGVLTATAAAAYSAAVVGLEKRRERRRPGRGSAARAALYLVPSSEDGSRLTALERALHLEIKRRARGGRPRRRIS